MKKADAVMSQGIMLFWMKNNTGQVTNSYKRDHAEMFFMDIMAWAKRNTGNEIIHMKIATPLRQHRENPTIKDSDPLETT